MIPLNNVHTIFQLLCHPILFFIQISFHFWLHWRPKPGHGHQVAKSQEGFFRFGGSETLWSRVIVLNRHFGPPIGQIRPPVQTHNDTRRESSM